MADGGGAEHGARASHVLSLCDRTGNMVRPWAEAGHVCIAVDTAHDGVSVEDVGAGSIVFVEADVRKYEPPAVEYAAAFAFPPCTDLAVSGARWFQEKGLTALAEAIGIVGACHETLTAVDCPWMLENPKSTLSTHWRKPDYTFNPFEYANYTEADESYSKETWLWTGGGFRMPLSDGVPESQADDRIHRMAPGEDRSEKRSETPMGFARAVFLAHQEPERYARADSGIEQARLVTDGGAELQGRVEQIPPCPQCDRKDEILESPDAGYWICDRCGVRGSGTEEPVWWQNDPASQWYVGEDSTQ